MHHCMTRMDKEIAGVCVFEIERERAAAMLFRILNGPNLMSVSVVFGNGVCHDNVLLWAARDSVG